MSIRALALCVCASVTLTACGPGPGAGVRWTSYPSLATSTTTFRWLVVKCQLSNMSAIPAGLDLQIEQFFGIKGTGYGNLVDYFHDVSYNRASVISDTFVGWVRAPFGPGDLAGPKGRLAPASARGQRVIECLEAIPADDRPALEDFYGVVVINNEVQDGGSCGIGQVGLKVSGKVYTLACQWFDARSLSTQFAAHEFGHGLGLPDSFDDSARSCSADAGRYCDPWDIMSAQQTRQFVDRNFTVAGAGPGMSAPGLIQLGWIPQNNQRRFDFEEGGEQKVRLRALSRPRGAEPLVFVLNIGQGPFDGTYTVEYRQGDGWDLGFVTDPNSLATVRASRGAVFVHQYRLAGAPTSTLINGAFSGALQPCNTLVLSGFGGTVYHVTVESFDVADGAAQVSIGSGRGKYLPCVKDVLERDRVPPTRSHERFDETVKP